MTDEQLLRLQCTADVQKKLECFSISENLRMAYEPVLIEAVAWVYAMRVAEYCSANRVEKYKKTTRQLRELNGVYLSSQAKDLTTMIRQRLLNLLPTYDIYIGGRHAARIVKKITLLRPSYVIRGCNWKVQGNFLQHDYRIYRGMSAIAGIRKRWLSFGDCFELDVPERENELLSVCMMLVIDCVMDAEEAARSSGANSVANINSDNQ